MTKHIYRNKENKNKYLGVKRYACGHYAIKQAMVWDNGVINYSANAWHRVSKKLLNQILEDYGLSLKLFKEVF